MSRSDEVYIPNTDALNWNAGITPDELMDRAADIESAIESGVSNAEQLVGVWVQFVDRAEELRSKGV